MLDGEERKITIHIENDDDIETFGMNAYPDNFVDFIILCNDYNFEQNDLIDDSFYDSSVEEWYDNFLYEIKELESKLICPKCSSYYLIHTDSMGYSFIFGDCKYIYEYEEGKYKSHLEFDNKTIEE